MGGRRPTFPRSRAVSSALRGLTSLFGMGRGAPPRYCRHSCLSWPLACNPPCALTGALPGCGKGEGRHRGSPLSVVLSRLSLDLSRKAALHCAAASVRAISAARLNVSQRSHLRPIDVVVYDGPQRRPHLGAGFALRCLQRLSDPDAATRLRAWRHDRHTVGPSDPVLSY